MKKMSQIKYFPEEVLLERVKDGSEDTIDLMPAQSHEPTGYEPPPYIEDPDLVTTTSAQKVSVEYNKEKDLMMFQIENNISFRLRGHNIDKLIEVIRRKRGK